MDINMDSVSGTEHENPYESWALSWPGAASWTTDINMGSVYGASWTMVVPWGGPIQKTNCPSSQASVAFPSQGYRASSMLRVAKMCLHLLQLQAAAHYAEDPTW